MKKNHLLYIIEHAIEDKVPYIAIKQQNSILKKPFVNIIPNEDFETFREGLDSYNDNLEFAPSLLNLNVKFIDACILKELPMELSIFLKI